MKIWTILPSFHVTPFLRIYFISLRGILQKRFSENIVRKFGRSPMNIGRSINFKTSEPAESVVSFAGMRNIVVNFRDPGDSDDVIITELNPNVRERGETATDVWSLIVDYLTCPKRCTLRISTTIRYVVQP